MDEARPQVRLLGPVEVVSEGKALALPRGQKAVLAALATHAGRVVAVESLIDALWAEPDEPDSAVKTIQVLVSRIRKTFLEAGVRGAIETRPAGYSLAHSAVDIDAEAFADLLSRGRASASSDPAAALSSLDAALSMWRGPALVDLRKHPFAIPEGDRLDVARSDAEELRARIQFDLGDFESAAAGLRELLAREPTREPAYELLMRALYAVGRQGDALTVYQQARNVLDEKLGIDPAAQLENLQRAILNQDPSLRRIGEDVSTGVRVPSESAAGRRALSLADWPHPLTSFIGRERELEELAAQVATSRLVTLIGPGGVGKTRLALELLEQRRLKDRSEVAFVDLAQVVDPAQVLVTIASRFGGQPGDDDSAIEFLRSRITEDGAVIVLDNFEHLTSAGHGVARLLGAVPGLRAIVTSQAVLNLQGEHVLRLDSLSETPEGLAAAVRLFVDRARSVEPSLDVDEEADAIRDLCVLTGGLPLAIELAAAQVAFLSPSRLRVHLAKAIDLDTPAMDRPVRHRALRATMEWSYALLDPDSQAVFRHTAGFGGSFDLKSCAGVEADASGRTSRDVMAALRVLVDRSLLRVDRGGRFSLLPPLREFAHERLVESNEEPIVRSAHVRYLARLAAAMRDDFHTAKEGDLMANLIAEEDNIRATLRWITSSELSEPAVRLVTDLRPFWRRRGLLEPAAAALARIETTHGELDKVGVNALVTLASIRTEQNHPTQTRPLLERAARACRAIGDVDSLSGVLNNLALVARQEGALDDAERLLLESAELSERAGNAWGAAATLANLGVIAYDAGRFDRARQVYGRARELFVALGDTIDVAKVAGNLAAVELRSGRLVIARRLGDEALAAARESGDLHFLADMLDLQGQVATHEGDLDSATRWLRDALTLAADTNFEELVVTIADSVAALAVEAGLGRLGVAVLDVTDQRRKDLGLSVSGPEAQARSATRERAGTVDGGSSLALASTSDVERFVSGVLDEVDAALAFNRSDGVELRNVDQKKESPTHLPTR